MLRSNDWLAVITANSRQDVKPEMVPWQHLRKPLFTAVTGHGVENQAQELRRDSEKVGFLTPEGLLCKSQGPTKE